MFSIYIARARSLRVNAPQDPDGFHPRVSDPDVRRAWASAYNGDFEKAAFHMENALKHFPDDGHNWETLEYYYAARARIALSGLYSFRDLEGLDPIGEYRH